MAAYRSWRSVSLRGLGNVTYPLYICFLNYEIGLKLPTSSSIGPWFRRALGFRHMLSWKGMLPESGPNELGRWVKCLYNPLKTILVLYTSDACLEFTFLWIVELVMHYFWHTILYSSVPCSVWVSLPAKSLYLQTSLHTGRNTNEESSQIHVQE